MQFPFSFFTLHYTKSFSHVALEFSKQSKLNKNIPRGYAIVIVDLSFVIKTFVIVFSHVLDFFLRKDSQKWEYMCVVI